MDKGMNLTNFDKITDAGIDFDNFDADAELAKYKGIRPVGWKIVVRLFVAPQEQNGLLIPDSRHAEQQYENFVGFVVAIPEGAYKDERYKHTGRWCKLKDWVAFPRLSGTRMVYKGIPLFALNEDAFEVIVDDPRDISR